MRGEWGLVSFGGGWVAPDNLCETAARVGSPSSPPCGGFSLQGGEGWGQLLLVSEFPHAGLAAPPRSLTVEEDGEDEVEGRDEEASHQRGQLLEERDSVGDHETQHDDRRGAPEPLELAPPPKVVDVPRGDPHVDHPGEEEEKKMPSAMTEGEGEGKGVWLTSKGRCPGSGRRPSCESTGGRRPSCTAGRSPSCPRSTHSPPSPRRERER